MNGDYKPKRYNSVYPYESFWGHVSWRIAQRLVSLCANASEPFSFKELVQTSDYSINGFVYVSGVVSHYTVTVSDCEFLAVDSPFALQSDLNGFVSEDIISTVERIYEQRIESSGIHAPDDGGVSEFSFNSSVYSALAWDLSNKIKCSPNIAWVIGPDVSGIMYCCGSLTLRVYASGVYSDSIFYRSFQVQEFHLDVLDKDMNIVPSNFRFSDFYDYFSQAMLPNSGCGCWRW